ncbi:hypothetical protein ACSQ67_004390 [Phaseolus vulgaris]
MSVLPNRSVLTNIVLKSTTQLNINITESLVECLSRATEMFFDAPGLVRLDEHKGNKLLHSPCAEYMSARKFGAPYVLQNLTSVPLLYHVYHGLGNADGVRGSNETHAKYVQPGSSIPIYMDENTEKKLSRFRPSHSSDSLNEQRSNGFAHHYITVQLEGTSRSSDPISMDLVGLTCFEVNFSESYNETAEDSSLNTAPTFVVPVVFDVSVLRHSKLIRIYSTVCYLGRYFKDIRKEQLKIRLEEVLLENVELILDAFDYLQLPFALKQGRVGKLSIKIPWKKPWDPIIIILEDVFISASQRGDQEWSFDAVEKREFAGKKAKLAAAELGKLSRRVCGSQAGQSFISHVTTKVSRTMVLSVGGGNWSFGYVDGSFNDVDGDGSSTMRMGHVMFGLKFTRLTMKQNLIGSVNGRMRVGQEHKIVEIKGLEFYSRLFHGSMDLVTMNNKGDSYSASNIRLEGKHYYSILAPCDATLTLSDNRLQKLDGSAPQYSVTAELSGLVISLDEVQLQHMCLVWDYICTCRLREKYGRFRPWHCLLPRKCEGWQIFWWHYAQQSVLSDVRRKLKKTSWRYFGDGLGDSLGDQYSLPVAVEWQLKIGERPRIVDDDVLQDLEQMEKESDLDDILNYRSAAESEMQEFLSRCSTPNDGKGTDDSSQFSGVVSYDVKDMSEATEFHPLVSSSSDAAVKHELYIFSMMFKIDEISATLCSKWHAKGIAEIIVEGGTIESKIYKDHGIVISKFKSGKMVDLSNKKVVVHIQGPVENHLLDNLDNSCSIRVKFSSQGDMDMSVKVSNTV